MQQQLCPNVKGIIKEEAKYTRVFAPGKHFQPGLIFSSAVANPRGPLFQERLARDKCNCLLGIFVNDEKNHNID